LDVATEGIGWTLNDPKVRLVADLPVKAVVVRCPSCPMEPGMTKFIQVSVMHGVVNRAACSRGCGTFIEAKYDEQDVLRVYTIDPQTHDLSQK
jgi:hypothetical protein